METANKMDLWDKYGPKGRDQRIAWSRIPLEDRLISVDGEYTGEVDELLCDEDVTPGMDEGIWYDPSDDLVIEIEID